MESDAPPEPDALGTEALLAIAADRYGCAILPLRGREQRERLGLLFGSPLKRHMTIEELVEGLPPDSDRGGHPGDHAPALRRCEHRWRARSADVSFTLVDNGDQWWSCPGVRAS